MDGHQNELRRHADKVFKESLDQLEEMLLADSQDQTSVPTSPKTSNLRRQPPKANLSHFDLAAFEEAAADIEAFMERQSKENG